MLLILLLQTVVKNVYVAIEQALLTLCFSFQSEAREIRNQTGQNC